MASQLPLAFLSLVALASPVALAAAELPPWTPDSNASREEIPVVYKWNLGQLFADDQAWEAAHASVRADIPTLTAFKGTLSDPRRLESCLESWFSLHDTANHVTLYAALKLTTAQTDMETQAMNKKALALMDDLMKEGTFLRTELLAMSDKQLARAWKKAPGLLQYKTYIENLRRRQGRLLGDEAERVLGLVGDNLWAEIDLNEIPSPLEEVFHGLITDLELPTIKDGEGQEVQLTFSNYGRYRRDPSREVRRQAVEGLFGALAQYRHALAATLTGQARFSVTLARARGYDSALEAYLDKDGLEPAVYRNLLSTVNDNLEPLHRYMALRKELMGVDELKFYDLYNPLMDTVNVTVPFDEARQAILEAMAPLGDEYVAVLAEGMDPQNGWLDLYPSEDKSSGAFSAAVYGRHPYVMMNYQDSLSDMSTLAHEYGHAMHTWLSMQEQPYQDFRYVPFLAEIASTANEMLLSRLLLGRAEDDHVRASLLIGLLDTIRGTIYRQTLFAEFELKLHELVESGTPVTASLLEETYLELVSRYYGEAFTPGENDGMEWAYVPHFYWKYYVFVYATGLSSGIALAEKVTESPQARDAYLDMLKAGCSDSPLQILKEAGADLTRPDAIESALELFDRTVTELEVLLPRLVAEKAASLTEEPQGEAD